MTIPGTMPIHSQSTLERVVVGLSGGVDSAVAALLLQRQGYEIHAAFMKNWEEDDREGYCAAAKDLSDAERVCQVLQIPLERLNFSAEYWDRVFVRFLDELRHGRTPNPDILCNRDIKFETFLEHALTLGAEQIATGHYVRSMRDGGRYRLLKGRDPDKDQSYFLYTLGQQQLASTLFPLGDFTKAEVRRLALEAGLPNHAKQDSTGICFIGERPFRAFLEQYLPPQPGEIRSIEGQLLGTHQGLMYYTLGQRKGLGIGGRRDTSAAPWFVVEKNLEENALILAQGHDHPRLFSRELVATDLHWIAGSPPPTPLTCSAKVRYRQLDQPCRIWGDGDDRCRVAFVEAQRAVTPGQSVVFYHGDECLGGGIIESTLRNPL